VPELPEVDLMAAHVERELFSSPFARWTVTGVRIVRDNGKYLPGSQASALHGRELSGVFRRGKQLVFVTKEGYMVCHNAMSGYWDMADRPWTFDYVEGKRVASGDDVRVELRLLRSGPDRGPERTLRFHDSRLFGSLRFYDMSDPFHLPVAKSLQGLGMEALLTKFSLPGHAEWTAVELRKSCERKPERSVKELLTDQSCVAGVGNIYAAEALWTARIRPDRPAGKLVSKSGDYVSAPFVLGEHEDLVASVRLTLKQAIARDVNYSSLRIYRRKRCPLDHAVEMVRIAGRSSYFCPTCQQ
jgi:formamidopyrimidine-DNA glycosylase